MASSRSPEEVFRASPGRTNYTRLTRLLICGGTTVLRELFDSIHPPATLSTVLTSTTVYSTLSRMKRQRFLTPPQWNTLFPSPGTCGKSEAFDITLLCKLFREICSLTAPATGWDRKPSPTDLSLTADLTRIKTFRNEIYGHVNGDMEMRDEEFVGLWDEIKDALVRIVKHYVPSGSSLVTDWENAIENLLTRPLTHEDKMHLEELKHWYLEDMEVKKALEENRRTAEETRKATEETRRTAEQTRRATEETRDLVRAMMEKGLQTQQQEQGPRVQVQQQEQGQRVQVQQQEQGQHVQVQQQEQGPRVQVQHQEQGPCVQVQHQEQGPHVQVQQQEQGPHVQVQHQEQGPHVQLVQQQEQGPHVQDLAQPDEIMNKCRIEADKRAIQKLHFSDFKAEINRKCKCFHPNTRQWILDQVKFHVDSDQPDSCVMLITAGPGMGKSTVAAKICQVYKDLGRLAACHFFQFSNSTRNNPRLMLQSIAKQMCDTVPGYGEALERKLQTNIGKDIGDMNCEELLTIFLEEPLCNVEQTDGNLVVVLDALDECSHDPRDELLKALRKKLSCFPSWLRFIVTSRPSTTIFALGSVVAVEIREEDQPNIKDLEVFFSCELKALYPQYHIDIENGDLVQNLVKMTKGLFLVAFFVIDLLKRENIASPENVLELFPNGISSVYENYFSRLKEVLVPYIAKEERFYKMLEAVVATNDPLPKMMFYNILRLKSEHDVPRQERKRRKDALDSLHCLFPVEGDHVTAFHKSVFDWLTLQEDEEHDFSVRVEDGNEVLASQCNEVLSDLRDGKKDLAKPLNLSDNEKYALEFLCHLVKKRSSVVNPDKYGFFSNIYLLTAFEIGNSEYTHRHSISNGIISSSLLDVLSTMTVILPIHSPHDPSCRFFHQSSFGRFLAFVFQGAHAEGACEEITPNALNFLQTNRFPYFDEYNLLQTPLAVIEGRLATLQYLLKCKEGFIAVLPIFCSNSLSTAVYMFQLDGSPIREKSFPGKRLIATSPNINFIVAAEENGNKIEILEATTLEVVSRYKFPGDVIETCHVFGDDQGWFIVIQGFLSNKVYVIEGLTRQIRNIITVNEGSEVIDVSCLGHIVVSRTWERDEPEEINTFTNNDGEVELMNWIKIRPPEYPSPTKTGLQTPSKEYFTYTYRELFLYHYDRGQEPIQIHPPVENLCHCRYTQLDPFNVDDAFHVSEDGRFLAYHYKDSIFIVNTSSGSLFRRCSLQSLDMVFSSFDILFVSESYLVVVDEHYMFVINVNTNEIEHRIYLPYDLVLLNKKQYLLLPEEDGKSFNLIIRHCQFGKDEVSRLVFHNLNL